MPDRSQIVLTYGTRQPFRYRHDDVNLIGLFGGALPTRSASYRVNEGERRPFFVEEPPSSGIDWSFQYKHGPARLRLTNPGDFNVEIPVDGGGLRPGVNTVSLEVEDAHGGKHHVDVTVEWNPEPVELPCDLRDLSGESVQGIGQVVNGAFDIDPVLNVIRGRPPAKPDSLFLLGSPAARQEATYEFRYFDGNRSKYIGLSDFFVRHEVEDKSVPIKPGWSTAGLATIRPRGEFAWEARIWIASGDRPGWRPNLTGATPSRSAFHVVRTDPPAHFEPEPFRWYLVRHQLTIDRSVSSRFKIWPADSSEPGEWLCDETDAESSEGPRHRQATFGLFQHSGMPSEWRDIHLRLL